MRPGTDWVQLKTFPLSKRSRRFVGGCGIVISKALSRALSAIIKRRVRVQAMIRTLQRHPATVNRPGGRNSSTNKRRHRRIGALSWNSFVTLQPFAAPRSEIVRPGGLSTSAGVLRRFLRRYPLAHAFSCDYWMTFPRMTLFERENVQRHSMRIDSRLVRLKDVICFAVARLDQKRIMQIGIIRLRSSPSDCALSKKRDETNNWALFTVVNSPRTRTACVAFALSFSDTELVECLSHFYKLLSSENCAWFHSFITRIKWLRCYRTKLFIMRLLWVICFRLVVCFQTTIDWKSLAMMLGEEKSETNAPILLTWVLSVHFFTHFWPLLQARKYSSEQDPNALN